MRIPGPRWECPPGVHVRLNGNLTARITADHSGRTLVLQGIRSARTLRTLSRAVASFGASGRYDRVLLDVTLLRDESPELAAALAADARRFAASGRSLGFVPRSHLTAPPVVGDAPASGTPRRAEPTEGDVPLRGTRSGSTGARRRRRLRTKDP